MAPYLELAGITKSYGGPRPALRDVSFSAERGEIIALLGPSGCGKTTLLNLIAGFLEPDSGVVRVDGRDMNSVPPYRRGMGMVFQSYALFPHLTVEKNVCFGLEMQGVKPTERRERCARALELAQLTGFEQRLPRMLSGGQQQRVAVVRALVTQPLLLLLDEPLSNLDALLRKTMREDLRELLKKVGTTTLIVTHDHEEALVIADRIILMTAGAIDQIATPRELYERPRSIFGARFMEISNLIEGTVLQTEAAGMLLESPLGRIRVLDQGSERGERVTFGVRPENIKLAQPDDENQVTGKVLRESYHGAVRRLDLDVGGAPLIAHLPSNAGQFPVGGEVALSWPAATTRVFQN